MIRATDAIRSSETLITADARYHSQENLQQLHNANIPALIAALKQWHPDIAVGGGSCYLREDFYTEMVGLRDEEQKGIFVGYFRK